MPGSNLEKLVWLSLAANGSDIEDSLTRQRNHIVLGSNAIKFIPILILP